MNLELVRAEIDKRYKTHVEFAKFLEVHPITLSRFLTGKTVLRPHYLIKLMGALEIKPEALMKRAS